ncbi:hypothetical protein H1D32_08070 [Anaerobacillus sp. CMMVII]|uniref:NTF2-like N-terminal transpeptidase domain-containing protein n=1 Tax=Anaerobacillus sp. CMMVII TaxID=2755588 RepID=UPI0021B845CE|nr:NTF2-like N-terminal transpeptidase domain-containing protein [Anaerobacillus sp. CMMVII]MCT8137718.1 hypothetical protein [Anaerobacillus sp. CMMVII]
MIKKIGYVVFSVLIISILGCSAENEEEPTAEEAFIEYAAYWEAGNYEKMYELLSTQAKELFAKNEFLERNAKIYEDIRAKDLTVTMFVEEMVEEEVPVDPEEPETEKLITYDKKMDTFAGAVSFRSEVLMTLEIEETEAGEEKYWRLNWTPAMIFDSLEVGDKVRLSTLHPTRGEIFDRNHIGLAVNGEVINMGIVPDRLPENEQKTLQDASNLLQLSVEEIEKS